MRAVLILLVVLSVGTIGSEAQAETPTPDVIRYEGGRLTVRVTDMPLDRLLAEIAAVTHATVRGTVEPRPVAIDFSDASLADGLTRIFGAESFMLTYASDGTIRTIEMLGKGVPAPPIPSAATDPVAPPAARRRGGSGGDPAANRDGRRGARDRARPAPADRARPACARAGA